MAKTNRKTDINFQCEVLEALASGVTVEYAPRNDDGTFCEGDFQVAEEGHLPDFIGNEYRVGDFSFDYMLSVTKAAQGGAAILWKSRFSGKQPTWKRCSSTPRFNWNECCYRVA